MSREEGERGRLLRIVHWVIQIVSLHSASRFSSELTLDNELINGPGAQIERPGSRLRDVEDGKDARQEGR